MDLKTFWKRRQLRKEWRHLVRQLKTYRAGHIDIMKPADLAFLDERLAAAKQDRVQFRQWDVPQLESHIQSLSDCMDDFLPPTKWSSWRENFDVLVVAVSVAMAFRAYFYQPFKIPTGSMQPTLYGIHTVSLPVDQMSIFDYQPLRFFKWLVTGETFQVVRAKATGTLTFGDPSKSQKPGYTPLLVAGIPHYVPNDVVSYNQATHVYQVGNLMINQRLREGDVIWSGKTISGDFVFVNRWIWNFRHPRRGDVMVFATSGIPALQQGTHYIKRMTGLPGESLQINPPNLVVNGKVVKAPEMIRKIAAKEKLADWAPPYSGFNPSGSRRHSVSVGALVSETDAVTLGSDQFYAMGDNSFNSYDSRYWGPVPERNLLGPATLVYWPFTSPRFGKIR